MKKITIEGMACQHCAKSVTRALSGLGGSDVEVNLAEGYAIAEIGAEDEQIKSAIEALDFKVVDIVRV
jgi:Cu+-exporting ATPase